MKKNLTIYYTSDTHGYFSDTDYLSGAKKESGLSKCLSLFEKDGNTIVIDGGDTMSGSPLMTYLAQEGLCADVAAGALNAGNYDIITLGNHDFDYGRSEIEKYLSKLDAVCVCANIDGIEGVDKYTVLELDNGLRIGVTGVVTDYVPIWTKPELLGGVTFSDSVISAKKALEQLKAENTDICICISHSGLERDPESGKLVSESGEHRSWEICEGLGFDIVLSGHKHIPLEKADVNGSIVCSPSDRARDFIKVCVEIDDNIHKPAVSAALCLPGSQNYEPLSSFIEPYDEGCSVWLDMPVGKLDRHIIESDHLISALNGSVIANLINRVQLEATGADISAASLGNNTTDIGPVVCVRDVLGFYEFYNTLQVLKVDRKILKNALERCAEYFTVGQNREVEISNSFLSPLCQHFNYDFFYSLEADFNLQHEPGQRVDSIRYNGEELAEDKYLKLCVNSYRATGGGGYPFYAECETVFSGQTDVVSLICDYLSSHEEVETDESSWIKIII